MGPVAGTVKERCEVGDELMGLSNGEGTVWLMVVCMMWGRMVICGPLQRNGYAVKMLQGMCVKEARRLAARRRKAKMLRVR